MPAQRTETEGRFILIIYSFSIFLSSVAAEGPHHVSIDFVVLFAVFTTCNSNLIIGRMGPDMDHMGIAPVCWDDFYRG